MKTPILHLILWLLMVLACIGIANAQTITYPGYTSYYNPVTKVPDSVIWVITKAHLQGSKTPRKNQFHPEPGMPNLKIDYSNSGYDQGHNSPYDDNYWSANAEYQCFSYINMFPQRHLLNAQTWLRLEVFSRMMALKYDTCRVKTHWNSIAKRIGRDSVVVPTYCIKEIWYNGQHEMYIIPNSDTVVNHLFTYYKVSK